LSPRDLRLLVVVVVALAAAPEVRGEGERVAFEEEVALYGEVDTNARRTTWDRTASPKPPPSDALMRAQARFALTYRSEEGRIALDAALGTKLFANETTERMMVGQTTLAADRQLAWGFVGPLRSYATTRAQMSGARSYTIFVNDALVKRHLGLGFSANGGFSSGFFSSWDTPLFSSMSAGPTAGLRYDIGPKERFELSGRAQLRSFPFLSRVLEDGTTDGATRVDIPLTAQLSFTSVRQVFLSGGLLASRTFSNSTGDAYSRVRAFAMVGTRLPADVTAMLKGAVQLTSYDAGISLGQRLFLADDDESQNAVELQLSRPWLFGFHTDARIAWYGNELARERLAFSRATASVGVRWVM